MNVTSNPTFGRQYQTLTFTANVKDITPNAVNETIINQDAYVIFKVNNNTLKDKNGKIIYTKVVNNSASMNYIIPKAMAGVYSVTYRNRTYDVSAVYTNNNFYPVNNKNHTEFGVERSLIKINFKENIIKGNYLSIKANITDYKGNFVNGTNKICVKLNDVTYTMNNQSIYYNVYNGQIELNGIYIKEPKKIKNITIVTGDRQAYLNGRVSTNKISII